jgi:hypothetical protein
MKGGYDMKRLHCLAIGLLLLTSAQVYGGEHKIQEISRVSAAETFRKFKAGTIVLVDSMKPATYAKYHILGAINLPGDGDADLKKVMEMDLAMSRDQDIIVYCD